MKRALLLFGGKFDFDIILMLEVICLEKVRATDPVLEEIYPTQEARYKFFQTFICQSRDAAYLRVLLIRRCFRQVRYRT